MVELEQIETVKASSLQKKRSAVVQLLLFHIIPLVLLGVYG